MSESGPDKPSIQTADDREDSDYLEKSLGNGLSVHMGMAEDGELQVRILEEREDEVKNIFASKEKPDFFEKQQTRKTIANAVADRSQIPNAQAKESLLEFFSELAARSQESEKLFQHPVVDDILSSLSDSVSVFGGETTTVVVPISWNDKHKRLEFTDEEWGDSPKPFKTKFFSAFYETPNLDKDAWIELRDTLEKNYFEETYEEELTEGETVAGIVADAIGAQVNVYQERSKLQNDKLNAWYDHGNSAGRSEIKGDQDVLWVRSDAVAEVMEQAASKEHSYMGELSRQFLQNGYTFDSTSPLSAGSKPNGERWQKRCYPFDPAALGISELSIQDADDDEDDEEGSADDSPDDGDDPDNSDTSGDDESPDDTFDSDDGDDGDDMIVKPDGGWVPRDSRQPDTAMMDQISEEADRLQKQSRAYCPECGWSPSIEEQPRDTCPECDEPYSLDDWQPEYATDGGQDRAEVTKLHGSPGAGKTTTLFEHVDDERDNGREADDILFCTFTRAGQAEAADEMTGVFTGEDESDVRSRAKTVHGAALSAVIENDGLNVPSRARSDAILYSMEDDTYAYEDYCREAGLPFTPQKTNPLKMVREGEDLNDAGNKLFGLYQELKLRRWPLRRFARVDEIGLEMPDHLILDLLEGWEQHKQSYYDHPRYEHVDYVDMCIDRGYVPEADVLFIDEFQDLSPQEYLLYKTWRDSGQIDRIYIAGDANQSIYSFRAGRPLYFRETDVDDEEFATTSYRCPSAIVDLARDVLLESPENDPQGFTSHRDGGEVNRRSLKTDEDLSDAVATELLDYGASVETPVYLLARTNYQVGTIANALVKTGIPFKALSTSRMNPWDDKLTEALYVLRSLRAEEKVPRPPLHNLLEHLGGTKSRRQTLTMMEGDLMGDFYRPGTVWEAFPDCSSVSDIAALIDVTDYRREMLIQAVKSDVSPNPNRVKVGTIHSAKGSEAPSVFLFNALSSRIHREMVSGESAAEEHRISYVGITRASEKLHIVDDFFASDYTLAGLDEGHDTSGEGEGVVA